MALNQNVNVSLCIRTDISFCFLLFFYVALNMVLALNHMVNGSIKQLSSVTLGK